jgi:secretion/DNA translocation related TadE-like protein
MSSSSRDRGAATVLALSVVAVVLTLATGGLVVGSVVIASHRARLAADLGSLAGAAAVQEGSDASRACGVAAQVARTNGAVTRSCSLNGADIELTVGVVASLWPEPATARSRAGPQR